MEGEKDGQREREGRERDRKRKERIREEKRGAGTFPTLGQVPSRRFL